VLPKANVTVSNSIQYENLEEEMAKTSVVTGAPGGIGGAMATGLATETGLEQ
jgi:hypothetical protein